PDMVFVGDLDTTLRVRGAVFGFRVALKEDEILLRHLVLGRRFDRLEYFTLEGRGSVLDEGWPANPSNGAVMIATAAMLRPKRSVVAGIDLSADPRGAYPGAPEIENDYLPGHDRDVDVAVIDRALARFPGEVGILSPALRRALEARRSAAPQARVQTPPSFEA